MARNNLIDFRRDTAAQWASVNPVLANGEPGWDITNKVLKVGDGTSAWSALPGSSGIAGTTITGDGVTDNGPAMRAAALLGGTITLAGSIRYVATAAAPSMNPVANTLITGAPGMVLNMEIDTGTSYRELIHIQGDNVTVQNLTINRAQAFDTVLFPIGPYANITFRNVVVNGNIDTFTANYCHVFQLGVSNTGVAENFQILGGRYHHCAFPLLQVNASTATTTRIRVQDAVFHDNTKSDLELNSPNGLMSDVLVSGCHFYDNQSLVSTAGWGVGLAFVSDAIVTGNIFTNYGNEAVHIEDYSERFVVSGNLFQSCGLTRGSYIQIITGAGYGTITDNIIDASANSVAIFLINALQGGMVPTPGGRTPIAPRRLVITDNSLNCGAMSGIYLEVIDTGVITGNQLRGIGIVSGSGVYTGNLGTGIEVSDGKALKLSDNTIRGFLYGMRGPNSAVSVFGLGGNVVGNEIYECLFGILGLGLSGGVTVSSNSLYACVHPLALGQGVGANKPALITNNHASGCTFSMEINQAFLRASVPITIGVGKTFTQWQTSTIALPIPSGAVITFSGGGVFTTTAPALAGAATLVGTLAGFNIAADETATYALAQWSTTGADNYYLKSLNADGYLGAGGYV